MEFVTIDFFLRIFQTMKEKISMKKYKRKHLSATHSNHYYRISYWMMCVYVCVSLKSLEHKIHIVVSIFCSYSSPYIIIKIACTHAHQKVLFTFTFQNTHYTLCLRHSNVSWIWRARLQYFSIVRCRAWMCVRMRETSEKKKKKKWRVIWTHGERNRNRAHRIGSYRCVPHNTATDWPIFFGAQIVPSCVSACCVLCHETDASAAIVYMHGNAKKSAHKSTIHISMLRWQTQHVLFLHSLHSIHISLEHFSFRIRCCLDERRKEKKKKITYARYALRFMCGCSPLFYSDYLNLRQQIDKIFFLWPINCFAEDSMDFDVTVLQLLSG